jgi:hypothetical protein
VNNVPDFALFCDNFINCHPGAEPPADEEMLEYSQVGNAKINLMSTNSSIISKEELKLLAR